MKQICNSCGKEKDISYFGKQASKKNGLNGKCKSCKTDYDRKWYAKVNGKPWKNYSKVIDGKKRCSICRETKSTDDFYLVMRHGKNAVASKCKSCWSKRSSKKIVTTNARYSGFVFNC